MVDFAGAVKFFFLYVFGYIIAVLTIIISILLRKRKDLQFFVTQNYSTFEVIEDFKDQINIEYRGKEVVNLTKSEIVIKNSGNSPIRNNDFDINGKPLIMYGENAELLETSYDFEGDEKPKIEISSVNANGIICDFSLLNPKEEIKISALVANVTEKPSVSYRLAGAKTKNPKDLSFNIFTPGEYKDFLIRRVAIFYYASANFIAALIFAIISACIIFLKWEKVTEKPFEFTFLVIYLSLFTFFTLFMFLILRRERPLFKILDKADKRKALFSAVRRLNIFAAFKK